MNKALPSNRPALRHISRGEGGGNRMSNRPYQDVTWLAFYASAWGKNQPDRVFDELRTRIVQLYQAVGRYHGQEVPLGDAPCLGPAAEIGPEAERLYNKLYEWLKTQGFELSAQDAPLSEPVC